VGRCERRRGRERGYVTAETAIVAPALVALLALLLWALGAVATQLRCGDAARAGARAAARGEPAAVVLEVARAAAPHGADVRLRTEEQLHRVEVHARTPGPAALGLDVSAAATAHAEPRERPILTIGEAEARAREEPALAIGQGGAREERPLAIAHAEARKEPVPADAHGGVREDPGRSTDPEGRGSVTGGLAVRPAMGRRGREAGARERSAPPPPYGGRGRGVLGALRRAPGSGRTPGGEAGSAAVRCPPSRPDSVPGTRCAGHGEGAGRRTVAPAVVPPVDHRSAPPVLFRHPAEGVRPAAFARRRVDAPLGRDDRGIASVWGAAVGALLCGAFGAVLVLGQVVELRQRVATGADLAALAAADQALGGAGTACAAAERVALAHRVRLARCDMAGEISDLSVEGGVGPYTVTARARAGPHDAAVP
jgi:secretion/DNA translocation related TadE-like protein